MTTKPTMNDMHAASSVSGSSALILVVEDDPNLLNGVCAVLELHHYRVITATNGADALHQLTHSPYTPDLIISDIMMPEMDGIQLLQAVRERSAWVNIPFIYLTALNSRGDVQRGKQLGVDDYLVKPFEAEDLIIAVQGRLKRHRDMSAAHHEQMSDLKQRILTILNHEFRTPLTFVVAYSDLLNTHTSTENLSNSEMLQFLKGVNSGATRLRRLIENFILLVELETGDAQANYALRRTPITNTAALVQKALNTVREGRSFTHAVGLHVQMNIPPYVADPDYLRAALVQLIENAVKFSPHNTPIEIGAFFEAGTVHLWVRDHGRGIPESEQAHIWDSFYQINRAVHEDQGSGSGLAIVRGICALHNGRALVESVPQAGSLFTIAIPLVAPQPEAAS
jgi:signal transduction histidine kinase